MTDLQHSHAVLRAAVILRGKEIRKLRRRPSCYRYFVDNVAGWATLLLARLTAVESHIARATRTIHNVFFEPIAHK